MINVVGVRFEQNGKMVYFDVGAFTPTMGDFVVAQSEKGPDLGEVIMGIHPVEESVFRTELPKILRIATEQDIQHATDNRAREAEALIVAQKKIAEHKLEMKLVSVECMFDNSKMIFYFTANGRVDFRALVKDLASHFKTRIELRQIGVRDEARVLGGLGPCGRPICCAAFLKDFQPVSIKMAKEQSLSLNPTKISGVCGRLMCCLKYEEDQYELTRKRMPRVGRDVNTPDGVGTVSDLNIVKETVKVRIARGDDFEIREYPLDQISRPGYPVPAAEEKPEEELTPPETEESEEVFEASLPELEVLQDDYTEAEIPKEPAFNQRGSRRPPRNGDRKPANGGKGTSEGKPADGRKSEDGGRAAGGGKPANGGRTADNGRPAGGARAAEAAEADDSRQPAVQDDEALMLEQLEEEELLQEEFFRGKQRKPRPPRPGNSPKKSDRKPNRQDGKAKNRNGKDGPKGERGEGKKALGQPVRRENTARLRDNNFENRADSIRNSGEEKAQDSAVMPEKGSGTAVQTQPREAAPRTNARSRTNWADALEKAMKQADGQA